MWWASLPFIVDAQVRDLLIAGLGDSFASGEGNPNLPVAFSDVRRLRNLYPERKRNSVAGSATWTDELCHRSLYGQQLRAALQIAIENPQASVTFLDYSCSGAGVDGRHPRAADLCRSRVSDPENSASPGSKLISGGSRDAQLYRLMRELCPEKPEMRKRQLRCPGNKFRRSLDFVFLSIGGNDIGFSNIVAWASLRDGMSASIAAFFGATVSAKDFSDRMRDVLPKTYARLAKAFEASLPLHSASDGVFDPSRIVLTAYPDLVTDEARRTSARRRSRSDEQELDFPANQSLDCSRPGSPPMASGWRPCASSSPSSTSACRIWRRDHGWTFAGHVYADGMFEGHGFCARNMAPRRRSGRTADNSLLGQAKRAAVSTCEQRWSGKDGEWVPYNPATQNYPYALRQRWVRTFNDAYMVVNEKVIGRSGQDRRAQFGGGVLGDNRRTASLGRRPRGHG